MVRRNSSRKRRIEVAYEQAQENLELATEALQAMPNVDSALARQLLPSLPDLDLDAGTLYGSDGMFATRADYERTLRYLDRINRAASSQWSKSGNLEADEPTTITSFRVTPSGELESEFMRRESSLFRRRENKQRVKALEEMGIKMKQVPVYVEQADGSITTLYSENRHPVTMWVPATGDSANKYREVMTDSGRAVFNPEVPDNAIVDVVGDLKEARSFTGRRVSQQRLQASLIADKTLDIQTTRYFNNISNVLTGSVGDMVSERITNIIFAILKQQPRIRDRIFKAMRDEGTLEQIDIFSHMYKYAQGAAKILQDVETYLRRATEDIFYSEGIEYDFGKAPTEEYYTEILDATGWEDAQTIVQEWNKARPKKRGNSGHNKDAIRGWEA